VADYELHKLQQEDLRKDLKKIMEKLPPGYAIGFRDFVNEVRVSINSVLPAWAVTL
jgi:hypothetical protein